MVRNMGRIVRMKMMLAAIMLAAFLPLAARENGGLSGSGGPSGSDDPSCSDGFPGSDGISHRVGLEMRGAWIAPSHGFFRGENGAGKKLDKSGSLHLKYSFRFPESSRYGTMYPTAYQGIGLAWNTFFDKAELGAPAALYVFQGARLASLGERLSLDGEWNFGASFGWKPFDETHNSFNRVVGSRVNAYIDAALVLSWRPVHGLTLNAGVDITHFSNGNTTLPNSGVNTIGARVGAVYDVACTPVKSSRKAAVQERFRGFTLETLFYGALRAKGLEHEGNGYILDGRFAVAGVNIAPMYRFTRCFQAGVSLDVQYDESANLSGHIAGSVPSGDGTNLRFYRPPLCEQVAAGLSLRAELVMPIFTIGVGFGRNVLYKGELGVFYQMATLKTGLGRHGFIQIGYRLDNFRDPSNLMLGLGWRFGNK